jgi:hypothetical protein
MVWDSLQAKGVREHVQGLWVLLDHPKPLEQLIHNAPHPAVLIFIIQALQDFPHQLYTQTWRWMVPDPDLMSTQN